MGKDPAQTWAGDYLPLIFLKPWIRPAMRGASHLPKGGFSGAEAASRKWDTVFANPLLGRWATEEIE